MTGEPGENPARAGGPSHSREGADGRDGGDGLRLESVGDFAGVDDGFERLWTPHRMAYVRGERPDPNPGDRKSVV